MLSTAAHCINLADVRNTCAFKTFFSVREFLQVIKCGAILRRCCNQWKKGRKRRFHRIRNTSKNIETERFLHLGRRSVHG